MHADLDAARFTIRFRQQSLESSVIMKSSKRKGDTSKEFSAYFERTFSNGRWLTSLLPSLSKETPDVALQNLFCRDSIDTAAWNRVHSSASGRLQCFSPQDSQGVETAVLPTPGFDKAAIRMYFLLSLSSLLPVTLLDVQPGMSILDLCAAPGGQTLALAHLLWAAPKADQDNTGSSPAAAAAPTVSRGVGGRLVSNEVDAHRRIKLQRMLVDHIPPELLENGLTIMGHDAHKYWQRQEADTYDRVLLNAPCSSHRQVVQQAARDGRTALVGGHWSLQACQTAAALQVQLVCAALRALKVGGRLVFSTCSMCPVENDDVVEKVLQRFSPECLSILQPAGEGLLLSDQLGGESTKHGVMILPDRGGSGPVYAAVFEKKSLLVLRMQAMQLLQVELTESDEEEDYGDEAAEAVAQEE